MTELISNCPRCLASKVTFDVFASNALGAGPAGWDKLYEAYCVCRNCNKGTVFSLQLSDRGCSELFANSCDSFKGSITSYFKNLGYLGLKDASGFETPAFLPPHIEDVFNEGSTCLAVKCFNAAGTMFRLCVDYATEDLLPDPGPELPVNDRKRRDLGPRLQWLFDNKLLQEELHNLALCIKDDGNDGAHRGSLTSADAEDLLDFTVQLLERRYTYPKRIELANARQVSRHR